MAELRNGPGTVTFPRHSTSLPQKNPERASCRVFRFLERRTWLDCSGFFWRDLFPVSEPCFVAGGRTPADEVFPNENERALPGRVPKCPLNKLRRLRRRSGPACGLGPALAPAVGRGDPSGRAGRQASPRRPPQ